MSFRISEMDIAHARNEAGREPSSLPTEGSLKRFKAKAQTRGHISTEKIIALAVFVTALGVVAKIGMVLTDAARLHREPPRHPSHLIQNADFKRSTPDAESSGNPVQATLTQGKF